MTKKVQTYKNKYFLNEYKKMTMVGKFIGIPALMKILGNVENKKILDLGCGSGVLSNALASKKAKVIGVDISKKWIDFCKQEYQFSKNINFFVGDASNLKKFKSKYFDFVIINMVLLNIPTKEKAKKTFKEVSRILKKSGILIFSDLSPLSFVRPEKKSKIQNLEFSKDFSYFKNGSTFKSKIMLTDGKQIEFSDIHWTLEFYTRCLEESGMCIKRIIEPMPIKNSPSIVLENNTIPNRIIFVCKKIK